MFSHFLSPTLLALCSPLPSWHEFCKMVCDSLHFGLVSVRGPHLMVFRAYLLLCSGITPYRLWGSGDQTQVDHMAKQVLSQLYYLSSLRIILPFTWFALSSQPPLPGSPLSCRRPFPPGHHQKKHWHLSPSLVDPPLVVVEVETPIIPGR